jgi:Uma2 family endonuclease
VIRQEPELHLGGDVVVPDLAGWRLERYDSDNEDSAFFTIAPDWSCEILSPGSRHIDRQTKARIYLREGVGFYWLVDPDTREIEAFERSADGLWIWLGAYSGEQPVRIKPFDAIEIPLAKIWGR